MQPKTEELARSPLHKDLAPKAPIDRLAVALDQNSEEKLGDSGQQSDFISAVRTTSDWLADPTSLASSPDREQLPGFYRDLGASAVNRAFSQLRGDGAKFFDWCSR